MTLSVEPQRRLVDMAWDPVTERSTGIASEEHGTIDPRMPKLTPP